MLQELEELVGAWELRSCTNTKSDGSREYIYGHKPRGVIMYSPDGWMSCHMTAGEDPGDGTELASYSGYYGPVKMRADEKIVEHHVRDSTNDWMLGTVQERTYRIDGDTLHLSAEMNGNLIEVVWSRDRS